MNDWQKAGQILSAAGAGLSGNMSQFKQLQLMEHEQKRKAEVERVKTVFTDGYTAYKFAQQGRYDLIEKLGLNRLEHAKHFPEGDFKDTQKIVELAGLAKQGDAGAAKQLQDTLDIVVIKGRAMGVIPEEDNAPKFIAREGGQAIYSHNGSTYAQAIDDYVEPEPDPGEQADRNLRRRQIAVSEAAEKRQSTKLSAGLEKRMLQAYDAIDAAQRTASEAEMLANQFDNMPNEGGVSVSFSEGLKRFFGNQDDMTEWRRRFNQVRLSQGLKNLPPGPATDRDMEEAMKGVPPENASPKQIASFLRATARMARRNAAYSQFISDFISNNRTGAGINQEWRKQYNSTRLGRKVLTVEIYEAALNKGMTPEAVMEELGISR